MKDGWKLRWNASENGFPHLTFIDVVIQGKQVIYSSSTTPFPGPSEINFTDYREIFRLTFLWSPMSENVLSVIEKYIKHYDQHSFQLYLYLSLGLWDVAIPGSNPKSKSEIDHVMDSYCNNTISNIVADYCFQYEVLCIIGTMPDFGRSHHDILDYATKSQFKFCSIHDCKLHNKKYFYLI
jgi:hypothetical protein